MRVHVDVHMQHVHEHVPGYVHAHVQHVHVWHEHVLNVHVYVQVHVRLHVHVHVSLTHTLSSLSHFLQEKERLDSQNEAKQAFALLQRISAHY